MACECRCRQPHLPACLPARLPACLRTLPLPRRCPARPLQVWVYEEADERGPANLYVHHSVMLPAFPLSVAWMDCDPSGKVGGKGCGGWWVGGWVGAQGWVAGGLDFASCLLSCLLNAEWRCLCAHAAACTAHTEPSNSLPPLPRPAPALQRERGNIAAVGSFEPGIELWDMDVVDCVEPLATLGGADYAAAQAAAAAAAAAEEGGEGGEGGGGKKKKKKKKKSGAPQVGSEGGAAAWRPGRRGT